MIIAAIIIGIILIFFVFFATHITNNVENAKFGDGFSLGGIIVFLLFTECLIFGCIFDEPYPTAMDVYQGKTTLEYKVVDGVKVDSVVIFKNDDYGKN